jgi:hypothetical protein
MQFLQCCLYTRESRRSASSHRNVLRIGFALILALPAAPAVNAVANVDTRPLSLAEAVRLADAEAPSIAARRAAAESAEDAIASAGARPQLVAGVGNLPVTKATRSSNGRLMTMHKVGVMQVSRREKRQLTERAQATTAREHALLIGQRLSVSESVAQAWIAIIAQKRCDCCGVEPRTQAQIAAATAALSSGRPTADAIAAKRKAMLADRISQAQRDLDNARGLCALTRGRRRRSQIRGLDQCWRRSGLRRPSGASCEPLAYAAADRLQQRMSHWRVPRSARIGRWSWISRSGSALFEHGLARIQGAFANLCRWPPDR